MQTKKYTIENLDCAHCGAKIEKLINEMDSVKEASLSFPLMQLTVRADNPDALLPEIIKTARTIEGEVTFKAEKAESEDEDSKLELITLIAGASLYAIALIWHGIAGGEYTIPQIAALAVSYLLLGGEVLLTAAKNIPKGKIFDENFLMTIATLGAFAIREYPEAVGVMLFFRVGELFEDIAVKRSRGRIMEAVDLRPETINLISGGDVKTLPAEQANVGDILLIRPGDRIPLDGTIIDGETRIDTSAVTGEPVPVSAAVGDKIISGCVNMSGAVQMRVDCALKDSMVTRILESVENAAAGKPKIDNFITRFAAVYTPIVVAAAVLTAFVIPLLTHQAFYPWIYTALSFLVMSCPCALVLSVPLAYFCGIGRASKSGILFKGGIVLEQLADIKAVVMDKTGTVTEGKFSVRDIKAFPLSGSGTALAADEVLSLCASAELNSTHPIAESIVAEAKQRGIALIRPESVTEISGKGVKAVIDGTEVIAGSAKLLTENGIGISDEKSSPGTEVLVAANGEYIGRITVADAVKNGAAKAIGLIKKNGIKTAMLTGDTEKTAEIVAGETGIDRVYAGLLPQDKVDKLKEVRSDSGAVMFVGDGINDAPVLAGADVGAAMGSGADAAIEAADVVFMNSNLESIPDSISVAKGTAGIAKQNVIFALVIKIAVMLLGITGIYSNMWLAVFADTGVAILCILNSIRILYKRIRL